MSQVNEVFIEAVDVGQLHELDWPILRPFAARFLVPACVEPLGAGTAEGHGRS
jgi:hypothetical protein